MTSIISFSSKVLSNTNNIILILNCLFSSYYFLLWWMGYIFKGIYCYGNVCYSLERVLSYRVTTTLVSTGSAKGATLQPLLTNQIFEERTTSSYITVQWAAQITALFRLQLPHEMRLFHARCCVDSSVIRPGNGQTPQTDFCRRRQRRRATQCWACAVFCQRLPRWPFGGVSVSCLSADNNLRRQLLLTGGSTEIQK